MHEQGPEAAATRARLTDRRWVWQGEGDCAWVGRDGETFCLCRGSGSSLDLLDENEVSEADWRAASTVRRFPTMEARESVVAGETEEIVRRRGWAVRDPEFPSRSGSPMRFKFGLVAGLTNSEAKVAAGGGSDGGPAASYTGAIDRRPEKRVQFDLEADEWARFQAELLLLKVQEWRPYVAQAVDGLSWSMQLDWLLRTEAGGANAYPPDGSGDVTPEFVRLLLAAGRLLGFDVWPGFDSVDALAAIPDERDRVEHLLLAAIRAWADGLESARRDPGALTEPRFEVDLLPHLQRLTSARRQVDINGVMTGWPRVGKLDVQLAGSSAPIWVELKWAKRAYDLHNCLWDAGKLAQALREGKAQYGYLVAGAPAREWKRANAPSQLFRVSNHQGDRLVADYPKWWPFWANENADTYPLELPTPVITVPVGRARVASTTGDGWVVRVARVEAPGNEHYQPPRYDSANDGTQMRRTRSAMLPRPSLALFIPANRKVQGGKGVRADTGRMTNTDLGERVLAFINRVRTIQELDELSAIDLKNTIPDDMSRCVLARAMQCEIDGARHPAWASDHRWVMRFADRAMARLVGIVTEQEWAGEHREVALPEDLVDLAVAAHAGVLLSDEPGFLRGWWVPADEEGTEWRLHVMPGFRSPVDELEGVAGTDGL